MRAKQTLPVLVSLLALTVSFSVAADQNPKPPLKPTLRPPHIDSVIPAVLDFNRCRPDREGRCVVELQGTNFSEDITVYLQAVTPDGRAAQRRVADFERVDASHLHVFVGATQEDLRLRIRAENPSAGWSNVAFLGIIGWKSGTGGGDPSGVVAIMEVEAPSQPQFLLHGTFPVPKGTLLPTSQIEPFKVIDAEGQSQEAQTEVVTWYPDAEQDGAAVVEILANVTRPSGTTGTMLHYPVMASPSPGPGDPDGHEAIAWLTSSLALPQPLLDLLQPGNIQIRTRDAFGNRYQTDLLAGDVKLLKHGSVANQVRTFDLVQPIHPDGPNVAPNLFGVHAYIQAVDGSDTLLVDLLVSNAQCNLANSAESIGAANAIYFTDVQLRLPHGWTVVADVEDPSFENTATPDGTSGFDTFEIVKPFANGKMQVMPDGAHFIRRLAIARQGSGPLAEQLLQRAGLAFVKRAADEDGEPRWSWWNAQTGNYSPYRMPLPHLNHLGPTPEAAEENIRNQFHGLKGSLENILESGGSWPGSYPIPLPACGWFHSYGQYNDGLAPGGQEIHWLEGTHAASGTSREALTYYDWINRMRGNRQHNLLLHRNGEPIEKRDVVDACPDPDDHRDSQQLEMHFTTLEPLGNMGDAVCHFNAPISQVHHQYVVQQNLLPDCHEFFDQMPIVETSHSGRWYRTFSPLLYLANDALVRDQIRSQAFLNEMAKTTSARKNSDGTCAASIPGSLLEKIEEVQADPHIGSRDLTRVDGWAMHSVATAYQAHLEDREKLRYWFDAYASLVTQAQIPGSGLYNSDSNSHLPGFLSTMYFHEAYVNFGLWGLLESVFRDVDPEKVASVEDVLLRSTTTSTHFDYLAEEAGCPWPYWRFATAPESDPHAVYLPGRNPVPEEGLAEPCQAARIVAPGVFAYGIRYDEDPSIYLEFYGLPILGDNLLEATQSEVSMNPEDASDYDNEFIMLLRQLEELAGEVD